MAIIKKTDIIEKGAENALDPLIAKQKVLIEQENQLIKNSIAWQKALVNIKKTQDGSEAKKLVATNTQLIKTSKELSNVEKQRIANGIQLEKTFAKVLVSREKNALALAKGKVRLQDNNKRITLQAKLATGLAGEYDKLSAELNDNVKAYKNLSAAGKANTKEAKKQFAAIQKLDKKLKDIDNSVGQNQRSVGKYTNALKGLGGQFVGALGLTGLITGFVGAIRNSFNIFTKFSKSASKLSAILGSTKKGIKALTDQAQELGSTTAYTASEVIALQTELAKLGFTQKQIEASTKGILDLAAATGSELASSAELAGATLRIFNLDAAEMQRVTDVLAKSTTISSLSMEKLATIMPTVGKTAQLAGVSLEKTAALAGTLTDRGLDASSAATSLRNIFLELSKKGITWQQAMEQINSSTDKNKTSMDLFGKRAAAAGVILSETGESVDELTTSLENADGAAQDMADTMLDNLSGDITKAKSAWEGFILSLENGNGIISRISRKIVKGFEAIFTSLRRYNEGISYTDQVLMEDERVQALVNARLKEQKNILEAIINVDERRAAALKRQNNLKSLLEKLTNRINKADADGIPTTNKTIVQLKIRQQQLQALIKGLNNYTTAAGQVITVDEDEIETKRTLTSEIKGQTEAQKKLNDEQERQRLLAERNSVTAPEALPNQSNVPESGFGFDDGSELLNYDAAKEAAAKEIKIEEAKQNALQDIRNTALTETLQFASDVFAQGQESKLARILSDVEAEKQIAKQRLDDGLINQEQYNDRIAALNKKARQAEAKADKRKALFDIVINTAIAVSKALGSASPPINFINAAAVGIAGGIQAAIVAAKPLPAFKDGTDKLQLGANKKGVDTIPAMLNEGERVVPTHINNQIGNISNKDLPELVKKGMLLDSNLNVGYSLKDKSQQILSNKLDKLNNTSDQMLTAILNGASEFTIGGWRYVRYANGETIKTKVQ